MEIKMDKNNETQIEAAVFRKMIKHLQERSDVQNIDDTEELYLLLFRAIL